MCAFEHILVDVESSVGKIDLGQLQPKDGLCVCVWHHSEQYLFEWKGGPRILIEK